MSLSQQQKFAIKELESKYGDLKKKYVIGPIKEAFLNDLDKLSNKYNLSPGALDFFDDDMLKQMYQMKMTSLGWNDTSVPIHLSKQGYTPLMLKEKAKTQAKEKALKIKKEPEPLDILKLLASREPKKQTKSIKIKKEPEPLNLLKILAMREKRS